MPKDRLPCRVAATLPRCELELYRTLRHIVTHPLNRRHKLRALWRFARWQTVSRLWNDKIVVPFIGSSRLLVSRGMVGATGSIYYGLPEFEDMAMVLHALRPGDSFIDVGANVGSYTVLAAAVANANVIAFEPIPATFVHLMDNVRLNGLEQRVSARNQGVGTERGVLRFTSKLDSVNHVVAQTEAAGADGTTIEVPIIPLDELADTVVPTLIKIDVEGFETAVLNGARTLLKSPSLLGVLVELNGSGARYGFDDGEIHRQMLGSGFVACRYDPFQRQLVQINENNRDGNTLYVRNLDELTQRVHSAPPVSVLGTSI